MPPARAAPTRRLPQLALGALGVVYGDIGTSPLYAFRACFSESRGLSATPENVIGVLSLIFWSLIAVVTLKYLTWVVRADNRGEGGILALTSLLMSRRRSGNRAPAALVALGLFGAALLYGDGMITPAISVLGAMEGLRVTAPAISHYVIPASIAILAALFVFQHRGTQTVGATFGPIMLVWFAVLAVLGVVWITRVPEVTRALSPLPAASFLAQHGGSGFLVLGGVFLVVTGAEALYADMGHFGRTPIRLAWIALVLPALVLNYFGQGALLLHSPDAIGNPFYRLAPSWGRYALLPLATLAAVVASQAVISGAFSLTGQALRLGYCPRLEIRHTSEEEAGQIYVPWVNGLLLLATAGLVAGFGSASALAGAYGIAVSATMLTTSLLAYSCARRVWGWNRLLAGALWGGFLLIDLAFVGANGAKILQGGWVPLGVAGLVYLLMTTWRRGRAVLNDQLRRGSVPLDRLRDEIASAQPARVPGTAVYMESHPDRVPRTLFHNFKHNKVLHERIVFLHVQTEPVPRVAGSERLEIEEVEPDCTRIIARYGFMESPNVPVILRQARNHGIDCEPTETTFVLGRETILPKGRRGMPRWRARLFAFMARNAQRATLHFRIPPNRVIEIGAQIDL